MWRDLKMVKFGYYKKLGAQQKLIYNKSDAIARVKLEKPERLLPYIKALEKALGTDNRPKTEEISQKFVTSLCILFSVPKIKVRVLARRPSKDWGELHGLYEATEDKTPVISVWMRTAKRKQVVAFKTFLRTIVHEFMHHLDYHGLKLEDSFHTEGFYKRESSLMRILMKQSGTAIKTKTTKKTVTK
jgi:hypothetical protein